MESNEIRAALRGAERAEAAPWVDYPPTPKWYPLGTGLWAAALVLVIGELEGATFAACLSGLVVVELGFLAWYRRYRGAMPNGLAPREFRSAILTFIGSMTVVVATVVGVSLLLAPWLGAIVALVAVIPLIAWYEGAYAAAASRTRERLG